MTECRVCEGQLKDVASFGDQYLSEFSNNGVRPGKYPLDLVMCSDCSLVQLKKSTPVDKLYTENYGYKSGINGTIRADLVDIVSKVRGRMPLKSGDIVLDIGANDGTLLSNYPTNLVRVGCEPIEKLAKEAQQHSSFMINDFFSYEAWQRVMGDQKAKVITAISCFYDLEDPNKFVGDLTKVLEPNGLIVVQQNYLGSMLEQNAFDNVVHEHVEYYSLKSLEYLLNSHQLEVVDVELNDINGGSFRTYIEPLNAVEKLRAWEKKARLDNWGTYLLFDFRIRAIKHKVQELIARLHEEGKTIYLYGASTRGNSLIQYFELNNELIQAAVERNPEKWGKKIASLDIPIISEEQARKDRPDYMLVCPWFFRDEFVEREKEYLEGGGHLIFPLPELEIV